MNLFPFKSFIRERCGLIFEGVSERLLLEGLQKRISDRGAENYAEYLNLLNQDEHEFHELVCLLTINETYFYREAEQLNFMVNCLIPRMLAHKKRIAPIRILSAGCSSGEEIYSIAMALYEKYGDSCERLFWLAGGDIDKKALKKAKEGCYAEFSFRGLAPELRKRYFQKSDKNSWLIQDFIKSIVRFYYLNLLDEIHHDALRDFDIIFFRNVSIYFDKHMRQTIQENLKYLLKEEGALIIGVAETLANDLGVFHLIEDNEVFYFTKHLSDTLIKPTLKNAKPAEAKTIEAPLNLEPFKFNKPEPPSALNVKTSADWAKKGILNFDAELGLIKEKRYAEALRSIEFFLEENPSEPKALLLKAYIALNRKDYVSSETIALQVLEINHWSVDAFVLLGLAAKWKDNPADAVKWFKQAVYACHRCWVAHYYLADFYRHEALFDQARHSYRIVLHLISKSTNDFFSIIPIDLPQTEVRFLCEHHLLKLDATEPTVY